MKKPDLKWEVKELKFGLVSPTYSVYTLNAAPMFGGLAEVSNSRHTIGMTAYRSRFQKSLLSLSNMKQDLLGIEYKYSKNRIAVSTHVSAGRTLSTNELIRNTANYFDTTKFKVPFRNYVFNPGVEYKFSSKLSTSLQSAVSFSSLDPARKAASTIGFTSKLGVSAQMPRGMSVVSFVDFINPDFYSSGNPYLRNNWIGGLSNVTKTWGKRGFASSILTYDRHQDMKSVASSTDTAASLNQKNEFIVLTNSIRPMKPMVLTVTVSQNKFTSSNLNSLNQSYKTSISWNMNLGKWNTITGLEVGQVNNLRTLYLSEAASQSRTVSKVLIYSVSETIKSENLMVSGMVGLQNTPEGVGLNGTRLLAGNSKIAKLSSSYSFGSWKIDMEGSGCLYENSGNVMKASSGASVTLFEVYQVSSTLFLNSMNGAVDVPSFRDRGILVSLVRTWK